MDSPALPRFRRTLRPSDSPVRAAAAGCSLLPVWVPGARATCGTAGGPPGSAAPRTPRRPGPAAQGGRLDPTGRHARRFLPELAGLPNRFIHRPWEAPEAVLREAGLVPGRDHPRPVAEHAEGRRRAPSALRARAMAEEEAAR